MANVFFSYSHADEALRNQLEIHLSSLKRQGVISAWHDRRILAGTEFDKAIDRNLEIADIVLLLVSPDFIASDYCYEREVNRAMQRHSEGNARVIPVILRPCDWHDLEFGRLLAAPTDGRAITKWPNADEAFLDVVKSIKAALRELRRGDPAGIACKQAIAVPSVSHPLNRASSEIGKPVSGDDRDSNSVVYIVHDVEGPVHLEGKRVVVQSGANVHGDLWGEDIIILGGGRVCGNVIARDRVTIRKNGMLIGDVTAASVSPEDGSTLKGGVYIRKKPNPE